MDASVHHGIRAVFCGDNKPADCILQSAVCRNEDAAVVADNAWQHQAFLKHFSWSQDWTYVHPETIGVFDSELFSKIEQPKPTLYVWHGNDATD